VVVAAVLWHNRWIEHLRCLFFSLKMLTFQINELTKEQPFHMPLPLIVAGGGGGGGYQHGMSAQLSQGDGSAGIGNL
jgi:hypothetical protein